MDTGDGVNPEKPNFPKEELDEAVADLPKESD